MSPFDRVPRRLAGWLTALVLLTAALPARAEPLTILLDWYLNPDHAPLVVAIEKGFFAEAGVEVELVEPADPNDPPKLVAAGKAPLAITYQPQLHLQVAAGLPLERVATLVATPLTSLMVLADGPVKSLKDLSGRKVGYSVAGFEDAVLETMLESAGVDPKSVELVNVNFSLTPALLSGQVAGVIGAYRNFELHQAKLAGREGRLFFPEEHGVPPYDELILVANEGKLDDPRLPKVVSALERAVAYILNHPKESWAAFVGYKAGLDDELNRLAWADTVPRLALRPAAVDRGRYARFAKFLAGKGLIPEALPVEAYAVELE